MQNDVEAKLEPTDTVKKIYKRYTEGMQAMQKPEPFLNNKSPIEYWADGRLRFNVYVPQRKKNSKQWRTLYRSAMVRNKILGIVAHVLGMMPSPSIQAQNSNQEVDEHAAQFFKDVVEWTQDHEGFDIKAFWALVTAVAEGTVILKDDYGEFKRDIKEIVDIDEETGKVTWKKGVKDEFKGAFTEMVPNDELLIANPYLWAVQEQPWLIRRRRMPYETAKHRYGKYKNFDKVKPGMPQSWVYASDFFQPWSSVQYLAANMVEVVEHYEKQGDHYDVVISGVQLTEDENPNPRHDKQYPFCKTAFEPIDFSFFWGKSLADKLAPEQDVYDTMLRQMIDRQHLRNIPPLITNNQALINEEVVMPGNITYVGAVDNNEVKTIPGFDTTTDAGTANILNTMMSNMSESSLDPMQTGNSPTGGTPTATQAMQMAQNAKIMLGLFGWMYGYLISEWTKLRCQTVLWRLSKDTDFAKITLADKILKNGGVGKRIYTVENGLKKKSPKTRMELSQKLSELEDMKGNREQHVMLDREELSNLDLYVSLGSQPEPKRTDAVMQALAAEKWNLKAQAPQTWNLNYAARQLSLAWSEDPDEAINKTDVTAEQQQQDQQGQPQPPGSPGSGGTPLMDQMRGGLNTALGMAPQNKAQMLA